jgi:hypothetical protein
LATLHDGDDTWRASVHGDQFLERTIQRSISTISDLLPESHGLAGQVGNGDHRSGQGRLLEKPSPVYDRRSSR